MLQIFLNGMFLVWIIGFVLWGILLMYTISQYVGAFINDTQIDGQPNRFIHKSSYHNGSDTCGAFVLYFFSVFVGGFTWFLALPAGIVYMVVRTMRFTLRARKAFEAHSHHDDGKIRAHNIKW